MTTFCPLSSTNKNIGKFGRFLRKLHDVSVSCSKQTLSPLTGQQTGRNNMPLIQTSKQAVRACAHFYAGQLSCTGHRCTGFSVAVSDH